MADSLFDTEDHFDENKDYLAELTGPGGKFDKTKYPSELDMYKALAKSNAHGDRYIAHKNKEFDELRESALEWRAEATAKAKFDEYLANQANTSNNNDTANTNAGNVEQPIDEKKIEELVSQKLQAIEAKRKEQTNLDIVDSRLQERFGDNARSVLKDKMKTLGISDEDLKFLAKKSPEAVFNALGLNQKQDEVYQAPARSSLRSDSFSSQSEIRDAVYYEKLKQNDPKKYFDPKISLQRLNDMMHPDFMKRYNTK